MTSSSILRAGRSRRPAATSRTDEFIRLAEQISGQQLDDLFETWLFTPEKPAGLDVLADGASAAAGAAADATLQLEVPGAVDGSMSRRVLRR